MSAKEFVTFILTLQGSFFCQFTHNDQEPPQENLGSFNCIKPTPSQSLPLIALKYDVAGRVFAATVSPLKGHFFRN